MADVRMDELVNSINQAAYKFGDSAQGKKLNIPVEDIDFIKQFLMQKGNTPDGLSSRLQNIMSEYPQQFKGFNTGPRAGIPTRSLQLSPNQEEVMGVYRNFMDNQNINDFTPAGQQRLDSFLARNRVNNNGFTGLQDQPGPRSQPGRYPTPNAVTGLQDIPEQRRGNIAPKPEFESFRQAIPNYTPSPSVPGAGVTAQDMGANSTDTKYALRDSAAIPYGAAFDEGYDDSVSGYNPAAAAQNVRQQGNFWGKFKRAMADYNTTQEARTVNRNSADFQTNR